MNDENTEFKRNELILDIADKRYNELLNEQGHMKTQANFFMTIISLLVGAVIGLWDFYRTKNCVEIQFKDILFSLILFLLLLDLVIVVLSQIFLVRDAIPNPMIIYNTSKACNQDICKIQEELIENYEKIMNKQEPINNFRKRVLQTAIGVLLFIMVMLMVQVLLILI